MQCSMCPTLRGLAMQHVRIPRQRRTRVRVPLVLVMGTVLLADKLLVHNLLESDHDGGCRCVGDDAGRWRWAWVRR
jgi:hypothetical protein